MGGDRSFLNGRVHLYANEILACTIFIIGNVVAIEMLVVGDALFTVYGCQTAVEYHAFPIIVLWDFCGGHIVAVDVVAAGVSHVEADSVEVDERDIPWYKTIFTGKKDVKISLLFPLNADKAVNENFADFYAGALLAARDLGSKDGINLDINVNCC